MTSKNKYITFVVSMLLFVACKEAQKNELTHTVASFHNYELEKDAQLGKHYEGNYYSILIDSSANLYDSNSKSHLIKDTILKRGDTFQLTDTLKKQENLISIQLPNGNYYYLSNKTRYFQQELEGMRHPLFGIVTQENSFVNYFNPNTKLYEKINLKKGDSYLYVLAKENPYINIYLKEINDFITVEYCCPINIIQAKEHYAIMQKYKSRMKTILDL